MTWQRSYGCAGLNHHTSLLNKSWRIAPLRRKRPSERKSLERLHEKLASSCERTKGRSIRSDVASLIGGRKACLVIGSGCVNDLTQQIQRVMLSIRRFP